MPKCAQCFIAHSSIRRCGKIKGAILASLLAVSMAGTAAVAAAALPQAGSVPSHFDSRGSDRHAIEELLDSYTKAVSTKDQVAFESLLLAKTIPFSYVPTDVTAAKLGTANYEDFQRGVFAGPPFTQRFIDVRIEQDDNLANVTLVFINTDAHGEFWGWKSLQLLKTTRGWKIASEFFTGHR